METVKRIIFGSATFLPHRKYDRFTFLIFISLLASSVFFCGAFIIASQYGLDILPLINTPIGRAYFWLSLVLWLLMRGRPHLYIPCAYFFILSSIALDAYVLFTLVDDEFRLFWLIANIPLSYLLLGRIVGTISTFCIIALFFIINPYLPVPYSKSSLVTASVGSIYLSYFFHIYRMRANTFVEEIFMSHSRLENLALRDTLTDVLNRRAFREQCNQLIQLSVRNNAPYSVLFIDLDHFKQINDTYGHSSGDRVLKSVAACLAGHIRKSDVVARLGGEEFAVFLPNTEERGANQLAENLRTEIGKLEIKEGRMKIKITASLGLVTSRQSSSIEDVQNLADKAMYEAKRSGRNKVIAYNLTMAK